jgi:hypothetical protein
MSTLTTPEQVMRDYLAAPRVLVSSHEDPSGSGWRAETATGGLDALPETIQIVKARALSSRVLYAVTYEDSRGRGALLCCHLSQDAARAWRFEGGAGGGTNGSGPRRGNPWINVGGGGWPARFYAGGAILEDDAGVVARMRLRGCGCARRTA